MVAIHDSVIGEMKSKPFTMILILALWSVVTIMWTGRSEYAMAGDLSALKTQVSELGNDVKRGNLETQLRSINTELFNLQQQVASMQAKGQQPDAIYLNRISQLMNDKDQIVRQLAGL